MNFDNDPWEYINPFPYIYKSKFDFEFDTFKDKVDAHLEASQKRIKENEIETPEGGGGISSVVLKTSSINSFLFFSSKNSNTSKMTANI